MLSLKLQEKVVNICFGGLSMLDYVQIKFQCMGFEFGVDVFCYWVGENYLVSYIMNVLLVLFFQGEQFFVDLVRVFWGILDDLKFKEEVCGFIGQEVMYLLEYIVMN